MIKYFFMFLVFLMIAGKEKVHSVDSPYFEETNEIYQNIIRSTGDARYYPELKLDTNIVIAHYNADEDCIAISPKILDFIHKEYPKRAQDAVALLLGHELAHFYKDHGLDHGFSRRRKQTEKPISYQDTLNIEREKQADKFAIYYSHLAGYKAGSVSESFIDALYEHKIIPEDSRDYPTQEERKNIYRKATEETQMAIHKFDAANLLILMEEYQAALLYYEDIAREYPAKQVSNNMAVANLRLALNHFDPDTNGELKGMFYPIEFDTEIDFGEINISLTRGGVSGSTNKRDLQLRRKYLDHALYHIGIAMSIDNNYHTAYLNKATILILQAIDQKESKEFLYNSAKNNLVQCKNIIEYSDVKDKSRHLANADILSSIILLHENKENEAIETLKLVKRYPLAKYNLGVLRPIFSESSPPKREPCSTPFSIYNFRKSEKQRSDLESLVENSLVILSSRNTDNFVQQRRAVDKDLEFILFGMVIQGQGYEVYVIRPLANYSGETCHKLKLGNSEVQMKKQAGDVDPDKIKQSQDMTYYRYLWQGDIIYGINAKGKIGDIIYFYSDKPRD